MTDNPNNTPDKALVEGAVERMRTYRSIGRGVAIELNEFLLRDIDIICDAALSNSPVVGEDAPVARSDIEAKSWKATSLSLPKSVGLLGAITAPDANESQIAITRLAMIEHRILRIEMLLRRAGIEPETIPLREVTHD